jgi:hypothetical protein
VRIKNTAGLFWWLLVGPKILNSYYASGSIWIKSALFKIDVGGCLVVLGFWGIWKCSKAV